MDTDETIDWDELLAYIEARSVVPVIGPELVQVVVEGDGQGERLSFERLLARQLAQRIRWQSPGPEAPSLAEVAAAYLARPGARRQALYREVGELAAKLRVDVPEPLLQLARIQGLSHFVSFCTDTLLAQALNAVRFEGQALTREYAFVPNEQDDLPAAGSELPFVYQLFGRVSVLPKYVVGEEDLIEWLSALQVPQRRPEQLFDELGHGHLLFIGCAFPDWLTRFVLRTAKHCRLSAPRGFSEYLVSPAPGSEALVSFLHCYSQETQVLPADPVAFVAELSRRWLERHGETGLPGAVAAAPAAVVAASLPQRAEPGSVFISYASEDRPAALRLAGQLQAAGLPVWLDREQLDWGADYTARIRLAIEQCGLFLPLLSATAEQRTGFYRKEWAWAVERNLEFTGASVGLLFPVLIDTTRVFESSEIPAAFKQTHIEQAPGGALSDAQLQVLVNAFESLRRRRGEKASA